MCFLSSRLCGRRVFLRAGATMLTMAMFVLTAAGEPLDRFTAPQGVSWSLAIGIAATAGQKVPVEVFGLYSGVGAIFGSEEDEIEITPSISLADDKGDWVNVIYRLRGRGDHGGCEMMGYGAWSDGTLVANIGADNPAEHPVCRLTLRFSNNAVVVSDPAYDCVFRACFSQRGGVDGAVLKKRPH